MPKRLAFSLQAKPPITELRTVDRMDSAVVPTKHLTGRNNAPLTLRLEQLVQ